MKELELKGCPSCGTVVVGEKTDCGYCMAKLLPLVLQTEGGWRVVFKDPNAKQVQSS